MKKSTSLNGFKYLGGFSKFDFFWTVRVLLIGRSWETFTLVKNYYSHFLIKNLALWFVISTSYFEKMGKNGFFMLSTKNQKICKYVLWVKSIRILSVFKVYQVKYLSFVRFWSVRIWSVSTISLIFLKYQLSTYQFCKLLLLLYFYR